jgi:hypothetical protein
MRAYNVNIKRFADKHSQSEPDISGTTPSLAGCVYNTDPIIMRGTHMDVVVQSHFRYERCIDMLFELQNVI